jgi:hypothetical protein
MEVENTAPTVEPTETQAPAPGTRADLIAAVQEAAASEAGNEPAAAAAPTETTTPEATPAAPEEEDRVTRIMKQREKLHAEQQAARAQAIALEEQAKKSAQQIIDEARAEAKRIADEAVAQRQARFKQSPVEALRELGDPQEIVDQVLRANTPEGKALREMQAKLDEALTTAKDGQAAKQEIERLRAETARAQQEAEIAAYNAKFLADHANAEKAPYLNARYEPEEIIMRARQQATAWAREGLKYGIDFDDSDVTAYLERQSKERVSKILPSTTPAAPSQAAGAPATAPGNAPKVSANGPRTLSAAQGSERRTAPKPLHELSREEQREALIEEVKAARRANPDAVF